MRGANYPGNDGERLYGLGMQNALLFARLAGVVAFLGAVASTYVAFGLVTAEVVRGSLTWWILAYASVIAGVIVTPFLTIGAYRGLRPALSPEVR